jgi:hypothetical protein
MRGAERKETAYSSSQIGVLYELLNQAGVDEEVVP